MQTENDKSSDFLERRRQLLRMGAAGMPMLLTLRASAREAVVSQLRCVITMPGSLKILVDDAGAAWVGDGSLQEATSKGKGKGKKGKGSSTTGWTQTSIDDFKSNANWVFPAGSAPAAYRPDACEEDECEDDYWNDDSSGWWHDNSDFDLVSHLSDQNETYAATDIVAGNNGNSYWGGGWGSWGDDDCDHSQGDDDSGSSHSHSQSIVDCGYACYEYSRNQSITPGNYVTQGGSLNITGDDGLYLALSMIYADQYGPNGDFPGVSCIVSVLNYIGQ